MRWIAGCTRLTPTGALPAKLFEFPFGDALSHLALVAQGIERLPPEQQAVGSNPIEGTLCSTQRHICIEMTVGGDSAA